MSQSRKAMASALFALEWLKKMRAMGVALRRTKRLMAMVQAPDNVKGNVRGLAVRFDLGQGATIDLVMISAPVFFVKTPALRWSNWVRPRLRR
jgi:hypothetical protein